MKSWRPFRFPPLIHSRLSKEQTSGNTTPIQALAADGFRQGMEAGYREGFDTAQKAGYESGYADGLAAGQRDGKKAGRQDALARFEGLAKPLDAAVLALRRTCDEYQSALREDVVDLVAKVARQVIRCELTLKPVQILDLIDETLAALPPLKGDVEVYLNAEECERIRELAPERAKAWRLVADTKLALGECRIRTAETEIDAGCLQRLDACLDKVRVQLSDRPAPEQKGN